MAVNEIRNTGVHRYIWDTADTKPTAETHGTNTGSTGYDRQTGIMYITYDGTNWVEKDTIVRLETSPTINIGNVELIDPDGNTIVYDEDTAHTTGDAGLMALGVRKNIPISLASADGDYTPSQFDDIGNQRVINDPNPLFGQPEIRCDNEGWGQWESKALQAKYKDSYDTNRHFRYGNWALHLNGGPQASEESWASVSVPIKGMRVQDVTSISYDWYAQYTGSAHILDIGPNLVFSAYDPDNHAARVDFNTYGIDNNIFMDDGAANRPIEAGWYKYIMTSTDATERVYYYANNDGSHTPCVTDGADYFWSQYIVDTVFKDWVIYRVQIMHGYWGSTRSTGDVWIGNMKINGIPVKWEPSEAEKIDIAKRDAEMFGEPVLQAHNNSSANWCQGAVGPLDQKSSTGWLACLYGGLQTNDDYARVRIPVNEMHVPDLKTSKWSYYMDTAQSFGVNMVIWVHDPFQPDNRAEITQAGDTALLAKGTGWNSHVLLPSTTQFYFYGEGTTNTNLSAGTQYTWNQFVADELFNVWTIYAITFENGWQQSGTFGQAWVADIEINGHLIPLKPDSGGTGRIARRYVDVDTGALALTIAPKTPFRLLSLAVHTSAVLDTGEVLTITMDAGLGANFDAVIFSEDLFIGSRTSDRFVFSDGWDFDGWDELNIAQANGSNDDIGLTVMYQTVFS